MVEQLRHRTHHQHQEDSIRPAAHTLGNPPSQQQNVVQQQQLHAQTQPQSAPHQLLVFSAPPAADAHTATNSGRPPLPSSLRWLQVRMITQLCLLLHIHIGTSEHDIVGFTTAAAAAAAAAAAHALRQAQLQSTAHCRGCCTVSNPGTSCCRPAPSRRVRQLP
jgi:glutamine synthetase adenylyltransferase